MWFQLKTPVFAMPDEIAPLPMKNGRWRYIVKAEYDGVKVTVAKFWTKPEAKTLRNKLRERFPEAHFYLRWDAPRPRWREMKACLVADQSAHLL